MLELLGRMEMYKFHIATTDMVERYNKNEVSFDNDVMQSCISANFTDDKIGLLKICADRLTTKKEDYDIVINFIKLLETMTNEYNEKLFEEKKDVLKNCMEE